MLPFEIGIQIFFLALARLIALFSATTFWGSTLILMRFRVLIAFFVAILMFPMIREVYIKSFPIDWSIFWFWIINNALIGLLFGFIISMFFSLFQIAGQFFSFQMGFSITEVLDPLSQQEMPLLGQVMAFLALLVFLSVNGHLLAIDLLYKSFQQIPLMDFTTTFPKMLEKTLEYFGFMFAAALQFSMAVVGSILVATLFIGLMAKAAPQINAMLFGIPLYVGMGFLLLAFLSNNMTSFMGSYINLFFAKIMGLFSK